MAHEFSVLPSDVDPVSSCVCVILRVHVKASVCQFPSKGSIVSYRTFNLLSMKQRVLLVVGDLH